MTILSGVNTKKKQQELEQIKLGLKTSIRSNNSARLGKEKIVACCRCEALSIMNFGVLGKMVALGK